LKKHLFNLLKLLITKDKITNILYHIINNHSKFKNIKYISNIKYKSNHSNLLSNNINLKSTNLICKSIKSNFNRNKIDN